MEKPSFVARAFPTAWGYVGVAATEQGLVRVVLPRKRLRDVNRELLDAFCDDYAIYLNRALTAPARKILKAAERQIRDYLAGKRKTFDLPIAPSRASDFGGSVWPACCEIPYGERRSYQWIAERIGRPKASRAVGMALGRNPLPLVVPCHRVVRSDGSLGGFTGGLSLKRRLLDLENAIGRQSKRSSP